MSRTVSDETSAKGSDVGIIQRVVIFLLQQHWVDNAAKVQWALCFQLGCVRYSPQLLWPREFWLLPAAESFIPGSCPNSDVWNNILPNPLAPLIWRGKNLCFPTPKVCKGLNSAFCQTESNSSHKLLLGWETGIFSTINIICSPSFLTFKNRTHTYLAIG